MQLNEIEKSISALDEAIEYFRDLNTKLNERSNYHWTPEIGDISSIIVQLCVAKKRLVCIHEERVQFRIKCINQALNTPVLELSEIEN